MLSKFSASPNRTTVDGTFTLALVATNTGSTDGSVPIQVYFRDPVCYPVRIASIQLVRFKKVFLKAQESKTVTIELDAKDLRYWDDGRNGNPAVGAEGGWVVPTQLNESLYLATYLSIFRFTGSFSGAGRQRPVQFGNRDGWIYKLEQPAGLAGGCTYSGED